jgi:hypothetical protein
MESLVNVTAQFMKPKILKILIVGIAFMIFGPVLGWILAIAGLFHAVSVVQPVPPGTIPDIGGAFSRMLVSLIPMFIGIACAAVGAFMTLYALITHMFGPRDET